MNELIFNEYYRELKNANYDYSYEELYGYRYLQEELYAIKKDDLIILVNANNPKKAIDKCKKQLRKERKWK